MEKLARAGNEVILTSHFAATAQITFQRSLNLIGIPTYFHKVLFYILRGWIQKRQMNVVRRQINDTMNNHEVHGRQSWE